MPTLNLTTSGPSDELIKSYLEKSASDELADKINNGVKITKDGKTLINKKDILGFFKFASEEARKTSEKGASYACVSDETVFGWAIHYFEEDSIEGTLYNEDGTKYQSVTNVTKKPTISPKPVTVVTKPKEPSLFDLLEDTIEEKEEDVTPVTKTEEFVDDNTGEIFSSKEDSFLSELEFLFGESLEVTK